ncbi:MAG: hypothetical protein ACREBF_04745 [Candidatus Micrarchaeales archaeon]
MKKLGIAYSSEAQKWLAKSLERMLSEAFFDGDEVEVAQRVREIAQVVGPLVDLLAMSREFGQAIGKEKTYGVRVEVGSRGVSKPSVTGVERLTPPQNKGLNSRNAPIIHGAGQLRFLKLGLVSLIDVVG